MAVLWRGDSLEVGDTEDGAAGLFGEDCFGAILEQAESGVIGEPKQIANFRGMRVAKAEVPAPEALFSAYGHFYYLGRRFVAPAQL